MMVDDLDQFKELIQESLRRQVTAVCCFLLEIEWFLLISQKACTLFCLFIYLCNLIQLHIDQPTYIQRHEILGLWKFLLA